MSRLDPLNQKAKTSRRYVFKALSNHTPSTEDAFSIIRHKQAENKRMDKDLSCTKKLKERITMLTSNKTDRKIKAVTGDK